ncbi:flagellar filament capping protein FliD [Roseateles chitosanitabidus]|uniref:flagellar filament capping protein FliD n=1 Tax=Roseateles chitosanitabidus TaxID=65048 RepID=UPI0008310DEA|nr:flagellar filament capping protein FliD [Roseateles chitosanitabidus]MBO9684988.1 flagellar filament capping protein FliD [Roseateles chitosanitabidus]
MGISSTGLGSNLNVEAIVQKLVSVERKPIDNLNDASDKIKTKISVFGKIQSALSALRDASSKLTKPETWQSITATSSDATIVTATGGSGAAEGSYAMKVDKLAAAQSLSSPMFKKGDKLGGGTLTFELGTWGANASFTPKAGSSPKAVTIDPSRDSLEDVRDKINGAGAGVVASLVNDVNGSRLVIRSKDTGAENGFRLTAAPTNPPEPGKPSLADLAFGVAGQTSRMTEDMKASNAELTVNGLAITSATNTIDSAIDGVTFNVQKVGTATVTAAQDKDALKKVISDFVTAYNAAITLMRDNTKYDAETKTAATLQGDSTAVNMINRLRGAVSSGTTLPGAFAHLPDIGLTMGVNGTISINDTKFTKAISQRADIKQLFMGVDKVNKDNSGIATKLREMTDQMLGMDGALTTRTKGLQENLKSNGKRIDSLEDRVANYEKRLRRQYTALDTSMSNLGQKAGIVDKLSRMYG